MSKKIKKRFKSVLDKVKDFKDSVKKENEELMQKSFETEKDVQKDSDLTISHKLNDTSTKSLSNDKESFNKRPSRHLL